MHAHGFTDLLPDGEGRIERGRWLLENHRHQRAANANKLARLERLNIDAANPDAAAEPRRRWQQTH